MSSTEVFFPLGFQPKENFLIKNPNFPVSFEALTGGEDSGGIPRSGAAELKISLLCKPLAHFVYFIVLNLLKQWASLA